jgi:hypothetical protein
MVSTVHWTPSRMILRNLKVASSPMEVIFSRRLPLAFPLKPFLKLMTLGVTVTSVYTSPSTPHPMIRFVRLIELCLPAQNQAGAPVD